MLLRHLFLLSLVSLSLYAQSAALSGSVRDAQDALIDSARLTLRNPARGIVLTAVSGGTGSFLFADVAPGTYELTAEKEGFATARYGNVILNVNDRRAIDVRLQVASKGETVIVTAEAPLVRDSPAVATSVDQQFIENQPLNGRSFQTLINLAPGVVLAPATLPDQGQFSVNGQRTGTNYFTVDGVGANFGMPFATTPYEGSGGGTPSFSALGGTSALASVDAVQEFTIQTSTYAPEYGRQPGAQVAIVTRSGTNQLHGSVFEYLRNDKLDANNWFANANRLERPALRQNDFGFTTGGPILRNKTFFFVSYEGLRLVQPVVSVPSFVPSIAARERATGFVKSLLEAYPLPVAAPLANAPDETPYVTSFSNPSELNATSFRIDHALTSRLSLFGRYNHAPSETRERGRYATPSFVANLPGITKTATGGVTWIASSRVTNDTRFNWSLSRAAQIYTQDTYGGAKLLPTESWLPSFADVDTSLLYVAIGAADESTVSPGVFSRNTQRQWNIVHSTSWNAGTHSWKFGVDYRHLSPSIGGRLFSKTLTVNSITQLASGLAESGEVRQVDTYLEPRYKNFSLYAQDAWKLGARFTLTYGLRWEVNPSPSEANGNLPLTVLGLNDPPSATLAPKGSRLYETTYGNFAPRIGIAMQPFRNRGTVIRGGFGMFYDLGYAYTGTAFTPSNYPYSRIRTLSGGNVSVTDPRLSQPVDAQTTNPPYPRLFDYADDYKLPYTLQYNFAIEQPFGHANSLSLSYVGAAGRRLARVESLRSATLRNPLFTRVDTVNNDGYSDYNSLQAQFKRRMSSKLQAILSYTWGKSLDTASDESNTNLNAPANRLSAASDRGPSSFDIRHAFTGSASYNLPFGFSLDSVVRLRTAAPVTIATGRDPLGLGLTNVARPDLVPGVPLYIEDANLPGGRRFNPAAFDGTTPLAQARQGTLGRGTMRGFNLQQVDLALRKAFHITERFILDARIDAFNILNTPNFANPIGLLTNTANFGRTTQILSTGLGGQNPLFQVGGPRSLQLSLKLRF